MVTHRLEQRLGFHCLSLKWVPHLLNHDLREKRVQLAGELLPIYGDQYVFTADLRTGNQESKLI
jgi:hypothetical protein